MKTHNCKNELREVHLKATSARLGVLKILEASKNPLDVATLRTKLEINGISTDPATLFRMMNSFYEKGLVKEVNLLEGKLRYESMRKADHHHFVCEKCGSITDISDCTLTSFQEKIQKEKKLLIKRHSLEFFGLCGNCQQ